MVIKKNRKISLLGAVSIGIGGMVGGGIFAVLGTAVMMGHGATPIAFLIAGVIALLTAYSYVKLSLKYPSEGGTVSFIFKGFGNNIFSKSINILIWLSYLVTISLYALAFGSYSATFFPQNLQGYILTHILITISILIPMFLNMLNAKIIAEFESYIVIIKIIILIIVIIFGFSHIDVSHFSGFSSMSFSAIIIAGMMIFVAYEGFELIANSAKDIKNPKVNLSRAYYISVILVIILYLLISIITVGSISEGLIIKSSDYALAEAARPSLGILGFKLVAFSAILATLSAINATVYGNARLGFTLAVDRELPKFFHKKIWNNSYFGVIVVGLISILLANTVDLNSIAIIASAGFLLIFTIVNIVALKLNRKIGANKIIVVLSSLLSFFAFIILIFNTYISNQKAIYIFLSFILFSILFEFTYGKIKDKHKPLG